MDFDNDPHELPLFPLSGVLFPGGLLQLRVFEARYLDMTAKCLRERSGFGVVALRSGGEVRLPGGGGVQFEPVGVRAELIEVDSEQPGILDVRCRGTQRFEVDASHQQSDGLWLAQVFSLADDDIIAPTPPLAETARGLAHAIEQLLAQDTRPFLEPYRFDDAGWVANRWCELLPISQAAKQKLMELPDPMLRLQLVDDYLRSKGVLAQ